MYIWTYKVIVESEEDTDEYCSFRFDIMVRGFIGEDVKKSDRFQLILIKGQRSIFWEKGGIMLIS